jgi:mannose-6-phosphate isomerase
MKRQVSSLKYPLLLKSVLKNYIWGGNRLISEFGKDTGLSPVAESWELSCHKNGESVVVSGAFAERTLSSVLAENPEFAGSNGRLFDKFPVLIKLIDAKDRLSVQVHPEDGYALANENGEYGKTEVWYIIDARDGAELIYGFKRDITKNEFEAAIRENTLPDIVNFVPVKKGDVFFIPAGLVHAIGGGILLCEIQQNSDTTYRVYDWGRVGADGKGRPLHIGPALEVSRLSGEKSSGFECEADGGRGVIAECSYFKAYIYNIR